MEILAGYLNAILSSYSPPSWATTIAGVFVVISLSLCMRLLLQHLSAYKNPEVCSSSLSSFYWFVLDVGLCFFLMRNSLFVLCMKLQEQKFLIGVILMVPFYAIESVLLLLPSIWDA